MAFWETARGFFGEFLLFLFAAATVAAVASVLDMFDSLRPKESAIVATLFILIAGILYATRTYCDERKWKRFAVTATLAPMLVILAIANVAHTMCIELGTTIFGAVSVWGAAAVLAGIIFTFRWIYLIRR